MTASATSAAKSASGNSQEIRWIAGTVIAVVFLVLLGVGFIIWTRYKRTRVTTQEKRTTESQPSTGYLPTGGRHELGISRNSEPLEISGVERQMYELDGEGLPAEIG
jgi:cytoskeletal protein RodZ